MRDTAWLLIALFVLIGIVCNDNTSKIHLTGATYPRDTCASRSLHPSSPHRSPAACMAWHGRWWPTAVASREHMGAATLLPVGCPTGFREGRTGGSAATEGTFSGGWSACAALLIGTGLSGDGTA